MTFLWTVLDVRVVVLDVQEDEAEVEMRRLCCHANVAPTIQNTHHFVLLGKCFLLASLDENILGNIGEQYSRVIEADTNGYRDEVRSSDA